MEKLTTDHLQSEKSLPTCDNPVSSFNESMKGKITSQARTAHQYYLTSSDERAGDSYEERMANFQIENAKTFQAFMNERRIEYRKTLCKYTGTTKANAGDTKNNTLIVQTGFHFIPSTIKRTTSGEWKGGPYYLPNETEPTSLSWKTGGVRSSRTYVEIYAKYKEEFIKSTILTELELAKKELNDLGIPVVIPPFLND